MRDNIVFTKYCYKCGKVLERTINICPHCNEDLNIYNKQEKIRCRYCRTEIPITAHYCKVCNTKNISEVSKKELEMFNKLKYAAEMYAKEKYPEKYLEQKMTNVKLNLNVYECYGKLKYAKRIFVKANKEGINIQTFEYGNEFIKFDEIICCYKTNKKELSKIFDIDEKNITTDDSCVLINTIKGNILLHYTNSCEELLHCIYYNLHDNVIEFEDSFYNSEIYEQFKDKHKK